MGYHKLPLFPFHCTHVRFDFDWRLHIFSVFSTQTFPSFDIVPIRLARIHQRPKCLRCPVLQVLYDGTLVRKLGIEEMKKRKTCGLMEQNLFTWIDDFRCWRLNLRNFIDWWIASFFQFWDCSQIVVERTK